MVRKGYKFITFCLEYFLPILAWLLVIGIIVLQKMSVTRMGLYRDLVYRNQTLDASVLSSQLFFIYKSIVILALMISIYLFIKSYRKRFLLNKGNWYLLSLLVSGVAVIVLLSFYQSTNLVAYPLFVLVIMKLFIVHFIRQFYYSVKMIN